MDNVVIDVSGAINTVISTIRQIVVPIATLALVIIGVSMVISDDASTKQKCKNWIISIAIGMALIVLAEPIAKWLQGIAKVSEFNDSDVNLIKTMIKASFMI